MPSPSSGESTRLSLPPPNVVEAIGICDFMPGRGPLPVERDVRAADQGGDHHVRLGRLDLLIAGPKSVTSSGKKSADRPRRRLRGHIW